MSPEIKKMQASAVLLAALCIPSSSSSDKKSQPLGRDAIQSTVEDDIAKEKGEHLHIYKGMGFGGIERVE